MSRRVTATLLLGSLLALPLMARAADDWTMDAAKSRLDFAASFEGAPAPGVFKQFDTRLHFDPDKPTEGRLTVTINVASADMSNGDVNRAIAGPEWFDFARFAQAEFQATEITRSAAGRYVARGKLRLKGAQQALEVPFAWSQNGDSARMEGEFSVKRNAFAIGTGEWAPTNVIGADVKVKFDVRLRKGG